MFDTLLDTLAPHLCYGCNKIGELLCDNCKYDIIGERFNRCILCNDLIKDTGLCRMCPASYSRAWCVGERMGKLKQLIGGLKFENKRAAAKPLGSLLHEYISILPQNTVVVPVPTVSSHIRRRGYDHTLLIAKQFAKSRHLKVGPVITRLTNTTQRGNNKKQRQELAKKAFAVRGSINSRVPYLLVDDVITTGATLEYCAQVLQAAGATTVWVAVVARQPLD